MNRIGRTIICSFALITAASSTVFGDDLTITSFSGFAGQTNILLQATGDITFSGGLMNLPALPPGASSGLLTVEAGNDIIVEDGTSILAGQGWSVSLQAGNSLNVAGTGSINSAGDVTIRTGGMLPGGSTTIWSGTPNPGGQLQFSQAIRAVLSLLIQARLFRWGLRPRSYCSILRSTVPTLQLWLAQTFCSSSSLIITRRWMCNGSKTAEGSTAKPMPFFP